MLVKSSLYNCMENHLLLIVLDNYMYGKLQLKTVISEVLIIGPWLEHIIIHDQLLLREVESK